MSEDCVVFGGVDTHRDVHVAAVVDTAGRVLASAPFPADTTGYEQLGDWLQSHGSVARVGIAGTGSYGAGLTRYLNSVGVEVVEVNRPNRQLRRYGKTDTTDAQAAARAALNGRASGLPKSGDGPVEGIRMLVVARRHNCHFWGLSPRVRGNRRRLGLCCRSARSIPACAGEPTPTTGRMGMCTVYPRVCGGTGPGRQVPIGVLGLSPRVRGNLGDCLSVVACQGSIPACAGEPWQPERIEQASRVYPRVCGGTALQALLGRAGNGLSPRVRGNLISISCSTVSLGSIPACAGEPRR